MRAWLPIALLAALLVPAPLAAAGVTEDAADRFLEALKKSDRAAQESVARDPKTDPWAVADELCGRGELEAAKAYVAVAPPADVAKLGAYLDAWKPGPGDAEARRAVARAADLLRTGKLAEGLALLEPLKDGNDALALRARFGYALALKGLRRMAESAAAFRATADLAEGMGALSRAASCYQQGSEAALGAGDVDLTQTMLAGRARVEKARGRAVGEVDAMRQMGVILLMTGRNREGLDRLEKILPAAEGLGDASALGILLGNIGAAHLSLMDYRRARDVLERAVAVLEPTGNKPFLSDALGNLASALKQRGEHARALEVNRRARALFEEQGDKPRIAGTLNLEGQCLHFNGRFAEALECFAKAMAIHEATGNRAGKAMVLTGQGNVYFSMGDYARDLRCQEEALSINKALGSRTNVALCTSLIGNLHITLGDLKRGVEWLERSKALHEEIGETYAVAVDLGNLGAAWVLLKEFEKGAACFEESIRVKEELGDAEGAAGSCANLGALYLEQGKPARAKEVLLKAKERQEAIGDRFGLALTLGNLGRALAAEGDLDGAVKHAETALSMAEEMGALETVCMQLPRLAVLRFLKGDARECVRLCRRSVEVAATLVRGLGEEQQARAREERAESFEIGAEAAAFLGDVDSLWFFLESGRAGALLESLGNRVALEAAAVPETLRLEAAAAKSAAAVARADLEAAVPTGDLKAVAAARKAADGADRAVAEVVERIQRGSKAAATLLYPKAPALEDARKALAPEEALVLFGEAGDKGVALVVTPDRARIVDLGPLAAIRDAAEAARPGDPASEAGPPLERLRTILVAPLALPATTRRVLVSPAGPVALVPFSALLPDREVAMVPSGATWLVLREGAATIGRGVLAMGDPDYAAGGGTGTGKREGPALTPLPGTREEARAVGTAVLLGKEATEAALRERVGAAEGGRWRAIHLACHGFVDAERPVRSSLALAAGPGDDGFLSILDVFGLKTPADLVVLSACETARGKEFRAEGQMGFPRAFMMAGAPRVLVSLWKVDDEATRALMTRFYELWNPKAGKGLPAAEALRKAQESVRSQSKWSHPAYWAAWQLWGLGE